MQDSDLNKRALIQGEPHTLACVLHVLDLLSCWIWPKVLCHLRVNSTADARLLGSCRQWTAEADSHVRRQDSSLLRESNESSADDWALARMIALAPSTETVFHDLIYVL